MLYLWVVGSQIPVSRSHLNGKGDKKSPPCTQVRSLPARLLGTGVHQDYTKWLLPLPEVSFPLHPHVLKAKCGGGRGRCASLCHAAPITRLPDMAGVVLGEVSHHGVWQGCFSSSTGPLCAFGSAVPNMALPPNGIHPTWETCPELALPHRSACVPQSECAQLIWILCF